MELCALHPNPAPASRYHPVDGVDAGPERLLRDETEAGALVERQVVTGEGGVPQLPDDVEHERPRRVQQALRTRERQLHRRVIGDRPSRVISVTSGTLVGNIPTRVPLVGGWRA